MKWKLPYKNRFGNNNRFTDENGLQEYKNNIVYDHQKPERKWERIKLEDAICFCEKTMTYHFDYINGDGTISRHPTQQEIAVVTNWKTVNKL